MTHYAIDKLKSMQGKKINKLNSDYKYHHSSYDLIEDYKYPDNISEWLNCPECGLKPKVWLFDNGRGTGCGCHNSKYDHFSIRAESINSVYKRTGYTIEYNSNELRSNWNHWCETGIIFWDNDYKETGMW